MPDSYDLIVIGGGPGGYTAAIRAAQLKLSLACIEKRDKKALGGTCLNVGCIPSKALLDSSEMYETTLHKLARHGIRVGSVALDLPALLARKDKVVADLVGGVAGLFKKYKVTPHYGAAKLLGANKVEVTTSDGAKSVIEGKHILLATGSESTELPFLKFDGKHIVSSTAMRRRAAAPLTPAPEAPPRPAGSQGSPRSVMLRPAPGRPPRAHLRLAVRPSAATRRRPR